MTFRIKHSLKENNPTLRKWTLVVVTLFSFPVVFMFCYSFFLPTAKEEFVNESFTGIVKEKFIDAKNHNCRTIIIDELSKKQTQILVFPVDTMFYSRTKILDSLVKLKGIDKIISFRKDTCFISTIKMD